MNRQSMIQHALNEGTLVIFEHGRRGVVGTVHRDLGGTVVVKVIAARGLRTGERVTVRATDTTMITTTMITAAREWLADLTWTDVDADDVLAAPVAKIIGATRRAMGTWAEAASCLM